jgi:hypothetical protein
MKYQYSSAENPCPICNRTKDGDCRIKEDVILCHTSVEIDAQKDGYVYRGATDCGMWGQYFPTVETIPKAIRPRATKEFFYPNPDGSPLVKVTRKDDGDGKKTFSQSHWNGQIWVYGLTDEAKSKIHLYRIFDPINQQAIANNQLIFIVEGESIADACISLGIPATTAIGGAGKWHGYGHSNYIVDLEGAQVVICPDRDKKGLQHADTIAKDFATARWCYAIPESPLWNRIPDNGGIDLGDWISDLKRDGLTDDQVRDRILAAVEPQRVSSKTQGESTNEPEDSSSEIQSLISQGIATPPRLFARQLASPLNNLADSLGLPVEPFYVCLLPILGARLKAGTRLAIDPVTDYYAPPIIWAGLVGDSGTLKTPILKALTAPLDELQKEAFEDYQRFYSNYETELQQWEAAKKGDRADPKPKPPALKDLYFSDFTIEAIADSIRYYPEEGYLAHIDELAAFLKSMDAYRSGKGSDRQRWLTSYGGAALKVNRKSSEPIYLHRTSISVVGGIQPQVLEKQVLDDPSAEDGLWARFIWVRLPMTTPPGISERSRIDLSPLLKGLYHSLNQIEAKTYTLSREAIAFWNEWNAEMSQLIKQEPSGILRATYPKLKEVAARIALISHIANAKLASEPLELETVISGDTLNTAIQFTRWLMAQTKMLYCEIGTSDNPKAARIVRFVNRFKGCGWVKTRTVTHWWAGNNKPTAKVARDFMAEVVALGYAITNDEPKDSPKFSILIFSESGNSGNKIPETTAEQALEVLPLSGNRAVTSGNKIEPEAAPLAKTDSFVTTVTTVLPQGGNKPKACSESTFKQLVTTVTAFSEFENEKSSQSVNEDDDIDWEVGGAA